jgi:phage N-6-adenine-methyltransferase
MPSVSLKALTATTGNRHDCWNTPIDIVSDVLDFFDQNLELDPCSNSLEYPNVPANTLYTEETNGLSKPWVANSVFMNHPYSESKLWVPYAKHQYECGNAKELILLVKLDISTRWWQTISDYPWVAVNRRLKFGNSKSAAPFQSAIVYLGNNLPKFTKIFQKYGTIYVSYQNN